MERLGNPQHFAEIKRPLATAELKRIERHSQNLWQIQDEASMLVGQSRRRGMLLVSRQPSGAGTIGEWVEFAPFADSTWQSLTTWGFAHNEVEAIKSHLRTYNDATCYVAGVVYLDAYGRTESTLFSVDRKTGNQVVLAHRSRGHDQEPVRAVLAYGLQLTKTSAIEPRYLN